MNNRSCRLLKALDRFLDLICEDEVKVIFKLGIPVEQSGPIATTPQFEGPKPRKRDIIMAFDLGASSKVTASVTFLDSKGNPAKVDGVPAWSTDNTDLLALEPAADGLSCVVKAVGPLGNGTVTMKADADLGDGVTEIIASGDVSVVAGQATRVNLVFGTPEPQ